MVGAVTTLSGLRGMFVALRVGSFGTSTGPGAGRHQLLPSPPPWVTVGGASVLRRDAADDDEAPALCMPRLKNPRIGINNSNSLRHHTILTHNLKIT